MTIRNRFAVMLALALQSPAQEPQRLLHGKSLTGEITNADPAVHTPMLDRSSTEATTVGKAFAFEIEEPGTHTIELRSYFFDAYLVLRDEHGGLLAEDDDGAPGLNSRIVRALEAGATYRVDVCALYGDRGSFALELSRGEPPALDALGERAVERAELVLAVAKREEAVGGDHPGTARALVNLANHHRSLGEFDAAQPLYERALAIREAALGGDHPDTARSLSQLAMLFHDRADYAAARPLYELALDIWERIDASSADTSTGLNNLATLLGDLGDYDGSVALLERSLAHERSRGAAGIGLAQTLGNLGVMRMRQGDYIAARPHLEDSLAMLEATFGPEHPDVATALNNLAYLLSLLGDYSAARPLLERAFATREAVLGSDHPLVAESLNNLSSLLRFQGDLDRALALQERALAIVERSFGPERVETADVLANAANLHLLMGNPTSARELHERALEIREKLQGLRHAETARSLNDLSRAVLAEGDTARARALLERALSIRDEALGPSHRDTAVTVNDLAVLARRSGNPAAARPLIERVIASLETAVGTHHPDTAYCRADLAQVLAELDQAAPAREQARRAVEACMEHARTVLWSLSEQERLRFLEDGWHHLRLLLSLCRTAPEEELSSAYDLSLAWRGIASRAQLASRERLRAEVLPEAAEVLDQLHEVQGRISKLLYAVAIPEPALHEREMRDLRARRNTLEVELGRLARPDHDRSVSLAELRAHLAPDAVFLDFLVQSVYRTSAAEDGTTPHTGEWAEEHVLAWIVRPGYSLAHIDLGPAAPIEEAVKRWLGVIVSTRGIAAGESDDTSGAHLRALLWEPLAEALGDVALVFVRPDSFLGTLPFEALPLVGERFLVEERGFVYVRTPADLLADAPQARPAGSLLALGGVDFRKRGGLGESQPTSASVSVVAQRGSLERFWTRLPQTEHEARTVYELHETVASSAPRLFLAGDAGTEERLKRELPRHAMLHLATHGFFHPAGTVSLSDSVRSAATEQPFAMLEREARVFVGQLPGLLAGLVCAGANDPAPAGRDDGLLTAEEVLWLDLSGVELVVLSACETALGERRAGEGMIGLRRAFGLAGARTVVSSLWSVKDTSTAELMRSFYENMLLHHQSRAEALRNAQLEILARNRASEHDALPSTWGAFVLSGEWR